MSRNAPARHPAGGRRTEETPMPTLNVNGRERAHDAEPDTPLLWVLR